MKKLKFLKLFNSLIRYKYLVIQQKIVERGIITLLLDLFFQHMWNNFLHDAVTHIILYILSDDNPNDELPIILFKIEKLIVRILTASKENERDLLKPKGINRGYMGFIYKISAVIPTYLQNHPNLITLPPEWNHYTSSVTHKLCPVTNPTQEETETPLAESQLDDISDLIDEQPLSTEDLLGIQGFPLELFWEIGIHESLLQTEPGVASDYQLKRLKDAEKGYNQMMDKLNSIPEYQKSFSTSKK